MYSTMNNTKPYIFNSMMYDLKINHYVFKMNKNEVR